MPISVGETTTQVIVKAYTTLRVSDVTIEVKDKTARVDDATVYWTFQDGAWWIEFVQLVGPFLKVDGTASRRLLDQSSRPADVSRRQYGLATPPEIVEAALALTPDWTPEVNETRYPRDAVKETSL